MVPGGSLPCLQNPATCPYSETNTKLGYNPPFQFLKVHLLLSSHLLLCLPSGSPSVSPPKPCQPFSSPPNVLLAPRAVATTVLNSVNYINYRSTCIYYFRDKDCWSLMLNTYLFTLTEFGNDYLQFFFCLLVLVMMTVFWSRFFFFFMLSTTITCLPH